MSDDEFYRIKRLPPYVIAEVNAMRAAARAAGEDIIDLGMGNPDLPPPQHVIDKLCEVAQKPDAHGYSQSKGIPGLRRAQANYYARRFNVELDPESEVVVTMGSKEGLASLATAITGPDTVFSAIQSFSTTAELAPASYAASTNRCPSVRSPFSAKKISPCLSAPVLIAAPVGSTPVLAVPANSPFIASAACWSVIPFIDPALHFKICIL